MGLDEFMVRVSSNASKLCSIHKIGTRGPLTSVGKTLRGILILEMELEM